MSKFGGHKGRDNRVILAWAILGLQVLGVLWLLLVGRDQLAAMSGTGGERASDPVTVVEVTAPPAATATSVSTAPATEASPTADAADQTAIEAVVAPERVLVETSAVAPEWLATIVEGTRDGSSAGVPGLPPHLLLTFITPDTTSDATTDQGIIDLNRPQMRIIPVATLMTMLEANSDEAGRQALQELLLLLERKPEAEQSSIPVPPILGEVVQNFVSRAGYKAFGGGEGVGYFTNISGPDVVPVTNESGLNYVYQGVTNDGEHYVFMSWPVAADFLPEKAADVPEATASALQADRGTYFAALRAGVDGAADADLSPSPAALTDLINSLSIDGQVAEAKPEIVPGTAFDAIGFTWHWTGSATADGTEAANENPQKYSLVLWPDGTYSIKADCNVGGGTFTYDSNGAIQVEPGPLSRALCPEGSRESEFLHSLHAARTISFNESGDMVLGLEDGGAMMLANAGSVEMAGTAPSEDQPVATDIGLAGVAFQWPGYTNAAGETVAVDNPEDYILTLLPDGTFNIVADCNVGGGTYTFSDDGTLQFGPIRLTMAACPDGSRGGEFVSFLEGVSGATIGDDGAVTLNAADGSRATFVNLGPVTIDEEAMADQAAAGRDPRNIVWQWAGSTSANGNPTTVDHPESYYLVLIDDGTYAFRADCNNGAGAYTLEGVNLTLSPGPMTLAACGEESLSDTFAGYLSRVEMLGFDDLGNLVLTLDDGSALNFTDGGPFSDIDTGTTAMPADNPLAAAPWSWVHFRDAKQDYDVSGNYAIVFNDDGTVAVTADCNSGSGSYSLHEGNELTISVLAITAAACPPGSLGDSFVEYLNQAGSYAVNSGILTIELMADGGTMTFAASQ